ncbi:hypothetical protein BDZ45DRAFT_246327 [Acephala macrosclerotiorum]|nr:hypothetical protein BDZ45DRAFT_246327 [Acephala macrosclerotiorum]
MQSELPSGFALALAISFARRANIPTALKINQCHAMKCFQSVRLSANLSLNGHQRTTSHPTQLEAIVCFGDLTGPGFWVDLGTNLDINLKPGEVILVRVEAIQILILLWGGRGFKDLFVPDVGLLDLEYPLGLPNAEEEAELTTAESDGMEREGGASVA